MIKRLVCLANSHKNNGRCIAGRELLAGSIAEWIRPVGDREGAEVSVSERRYADGSEPRVLDVIDVPLIGPRARLHQSENWLLDPRTRWCKVGEFPDDYLGSLVDPPVLLWINGHHTYNGENDYVLGEEIDKVDSSLMLIGVDGGLQLHVWTTGRAFDNPRRRVQAEFSFNGVTYRLSVTDPLIKTWACAQPEGVYPVGLRYLTISLGEPWRDGRCYKLVAAIIGAHDETRYGRI